MQPGGAACVLGCVTARAFALATVLLLPVAACDKDGDGDGKSDQSDPHAAARKKILGTWVEQGADEGSAEIYELTDSRFKSIYPATGGKPMEGPYEIVKVDGDKIHIKPTIEMGGGKSFPGDEQIITVIDADTIERHNAVNDAGGKYTRKK